jgi:hypothetical protein
VFRFFSSSGSLFALQCPKGLHATPRRGKGGRGGRGLSVQALSVGVNTEGYDRSIPGHLRQLLDDWEEEMLGYHPTTQRTQKHRRSYWTIKNILARTLLRLPGVLEKHSSPSEPSSDSQSSSSGDTREDPDPPKHKDLQQSGEQRACKETKGIKWGNCLP